MTLHPTPLRPVTPRVVPGDPSASAFFVVAGCVVPGSSVTVEGIYQGPARLGYISVLQRMGAQITVTTSPDGTADARSHGESARRTSVPRHHGGSGRDPLPRRDPRTGRGRRRCARHDDLQGRGGVAGQRSRSAAGGDRHGHRLRSPGRRRRRHAVDHRRRRRLGRHPPPRGALRQPGRPPHGDGRRRGRTRRCTGGAQSPHRVRRGGDQLSRRSPTTSAA